MTTACTITTQRDLPQLISDYTLSELIDLALWATARQTELAVFIKRSMDRFEEAKAAGNMELAAHFDRVANHNAAQLDASRTSMLVIGRAIARELTLYLIDSQVPPRPAKGDKEPTPCR